MSPSDRVSRWVIIMVQGLAFAVAAVALVIGGLATRGYTSLVAITTALGAVITNVLSELARERHRHRAALALLLLAAALFAAFFILILVTPGR